MRISRTIRSAGSGPRVAADAAPYFRIFNPDLQQKKFDPEGSYRKRWIPANYDETPVVSHADARDAALAAYETVRASR